MELKFVLNSLIKIVLILTVCGGAYAQLTPPPLPPACTSTRTTNCSVTADSSGNVSVGGTVLKPNYGVIGTLGAFASATTVVDDGSYNAFPGLAKTSSGLYVAVYRKGTAHVNTANSSIMLRTSPDRGLTWSAASTVYTSASVDSRDPSIAVLADGTWLVNFFTYNAVGIVPIAVYTTRSTDSGATWSAPVAVTSTYTAGYGVSGHPLQLANGDVLQFTYGRDIGDTYDSVHVSKSTNGGVSWAHLAVVVNGQTASKSRNEQSCVLMPDASLVLFLRNETDGKTDRVVSTDSGATWGAVSTVSATILGMRPDVIRTANGNMVLVGRGAAPLAGSGQTIHGVSTNDGVTWPTTYSTIASDPGPNGDGNSMYASMIEDGDNQISEVYCSELSSSSSSCYFRRFTYGTGLVPFPVVNAAQIYGHGTMQNIGGIIKGAVSTSSYATFNAPPLSNSGTGSIGPTSPQIGDIWNSYSNLHFRRGLPSATTHTLLSQPSGISTNDLSTWLGGNSASTVGGQFAHNGLRTAANLVDGTANTSHYIQLSLTGTNASYTVSAYMKAGSVNWGYLDLYYGGANHTAFFDLANGVVGTATGMTSPTMVSVGNGWYLCRAVYAVPGTAGLDFLIGSATADNTMAYAGSGTTAIVVNDPLLTLTTQAATMPGNVLSSCTYATRPTTLGTKCYCTDCDAPTVLGTANACSTGGAGGGAIATGYAGTAYCSVN